MVLMLTRSSLPLFPDSGTASRALQDVASDLPTPHILLKPCVPTPENVQLFILQSSEAPGRPHSDTKPINFNDHKGP